MVEDQVGVGPADVSAPRKPRVDDRRPKQEVAQRVIRGPGQGAKVGEPVVLGDREEVTHRSLRFRTAKQRVLDLPRSYAKVLLLQREDNAMAVEGVFRSLVQAAADRSGAPGGAIERLEESNPLRPSARRWL